MSGEDANHFGESIREVLRLFFSGYYGCAQKYFGSLLESVRDPRWGVLLSLLLTGSMTARLVARSDISDY